MLSYRFQPDPASIKKRIEALIDRDFIERDSKDLRLYNYLAWISIILYLNRKIWKGIPSLQFRHLLLMHLLFLPFFLRPLILMAKLLQLKNRNRANRKVRTIQVLLLVWLETFWNKRKKYLLHYQTQLKNSKQCIDRSLLLSWKKEHLLLPLIVSHFPRVLNLELLPLLLMWNNLNKWVSWMWSPQCPQEEVVRS